MRAPAPTAPMTEIVDYFLDRVYAEFGPGIDDERALAVAEGRAARYVR